MKSTIRTLAACAAFVAGAWTCAAQAQTAIEARLRDQLRQTTTELRQAQDENSELKLKLQNLPQEAPAPAAKPAAPAVDEARLRSLQAAARAEGAKSAALQQQLDEARKTLEQWQQSYAQAVTLAKGRDADAKKFQALYQDTDGRNKSCEQSNIRLVQLSDELLQRYRNKGVWSALGNAEPLTGLGRVELEKIAQDYHGRIVDATVKPAVEAEAAP